MNSQDKQNEELEVLICKKGLRDHRINILQSNEDMQNVTCFSRALLGFHSHAVLKKNIGVQFH